jgi:hypothetical protein
MSGNRNKQAILQDDKGSDEKGKAGHVLIIRNIPEELYASLWNMRRKMNAGSWREMLEKIVEEWKREELEWI